MGRRWWWLAFREIVGLGLLDLSVLVWIFMAPQSLSPKKRKD